VSAPPLDVRIRPMVEPDLERVLAIANSHCDAPHWSLAAYQAACNPKNAPQRIALVAAVRQSGAIAGFTVASLLPPQAEIEIIAVAAEFQRQGVARQLLIALMTAPNIVQASEILLEVRASNPALLLYRSLGFEQCGLRSGYYADPVEDALLMRLPLSWDNA